MPPTPSEAVLITGCSSGIGAADRPPPRRARLDRLRHRPPPRDARRARGGGLPHARARRDRRGLDAGRGRRRRRRSTAPSASSSTTPATARPGRSSPSRSSRSARSSRPTSSASCACASSSCPRCARSAGARSSTSPRWAGASRSPAAGLYHATKYAVEAISDALRFEVRGFGVDVIVIEPGIILTGFGEHARTRASRGDGPYARLRRRGRGGLRGGLREGPARAARRPARGGRRAHRQGASPRPARGPATRSPPSARALIAQQALLPDAGWDAVMRTTFPQPGRGLIHRSSAAADRPTRRAAAVVTEYCRSRCTRAPGRVARARRATTPKPSPRCCARASGRTSASRGDHGGRRARGVGGAGAELGRRRVGRGGRRRRARRLRAS